MAAKAELRELGFRQVPRSAAIQMAGIQNHRTAAVGRSATTEPLKILPQSCRLRKCNTSGCPMYLCCVSITIISDGNIAPVLVPATQVRNTRSKRSLNIGRPIPVEQTCRYLPRLAWFFGQSLPSLSVGRDI